jgi:hypothetical protein
MPTAPPADVVEKVTSYIKHNATKDTPALRELVQTGHAQISGLLDGLSETQATFKPGPEDWSVLELMAHVVTAKGGVARICERLARGEQIPGAGREGDEQDGITRERFTSLAEARQAMDVAHAELLSFIDGPLAQANTEARFNHFVFGDLNCREWAAFQRVHDGDHAGQIEKIKAAQGYPA